MLCTPYIVFFMSSGSSSVNTLNYVDCKSSVTITTEATKKRAKPKNWKMSVKICHITSWAAHVGGTVPSIYKYNKF